MSDDFDREAERERLREKYERDQAKREATEQMSELLLQGATMTNRHCPECHSPVFRYDGQEFCPTCQREVTEDGELVGEGGEGEPGAQGAEGTAADGTPADAATNGDAGEAVQQDPSPDATTPDATEAAPDADQPAQDPEPSTPDTEQPAEPSADERPAETRPATTGERRPARVDPPARREEPTTRREAPTEGGDLGEAEAALVREITDLTRRAEETRDVGRERDLFEAAREATETLRELRRL